MKEKEEVVNSQPSSSTTSNKNMIRLIMVWIFVLLAGMLGIALLVATKTVAGLSCIGIALTIALPLHRVIHNHQTLKWSRITAILIFSASIFLNIAYPSIPFQKNPLSSSSDHLHSLKPLIVKKSKVYTWMILQRRHHLKILSNFSLK